MSTSAQAAVSQVAPLDAAEVAVLHATGIPVERNDIVVNGTRLHYLTCGEGEPLVLLHERGLAGALYAPILPRLAARRRIYTLDLPGWGLSDKPPFSSHSPRDALRLWTDGVLGFLDSQGLTEVALAGHAMGGFVALKAALEQPERISRLVLIDPAGLGTSMQLDVRLYFGLTPERLHRRFGRRFSRMVLANQGGTRGPELEGQLFDLYHLLLTQEAVLASGAAAFHTWVNLTGVHLTLTDQLKELAIPVLLMWGDRDTVCKYEDGLAAARYPRDGQLVAFTGCGHAPFWERPDEFARVLLTWLDNIHIPSRV
jgi:pimeloyl-ACP methyl ester carboxylesterase